MPGQSTSLQSTSLQIGSFGEWVRQCRRALDITQEELADRLGCSVETVRKIERGIRRPSKQVAELLADALLVPDEERPSFLSLARAGSETASTSPQPAPAPRHNLPTYPTSFIGRQRELADLTALLSNERVRLLVLTGPGGSGKTRLAVQLAYRLLEWFPDGVFFAGLAPITDPVLVLPTIARSLDVKEKGGRPLLDVIKNYLSDKRALMMADNFEQVAEAAPLLADVAMAAPRLKTVVTSRVALNVYGEQAYEVPPLPLPELEENAPLEQLSENEAVRLFIERARSARPDLRVDEPAMRAIAELCVRLDGLPLTIELAAARVRGLPPRSMLTQMSHRLRLLTGGPRDMPARQQTLRNTIEWSYDLLNDEEKKLFRRLGVFQGGRTLEAMEAVCNAERDLRIELLDGVTSLVDKNLVRQREGADGEPRYWMLETIYEFAREKLQESGEAQALAREHAHYFFALCEEAESHLSGPGQQEWFDRLEGEHDNIRAALRWAEEREETEDIEAGLLAASAILQFWLFRTYYSEGREYLHALLAKAACLPPPGCSKESRATALNAEAFVARFDMDNAAAQPLAEEALELARETGDKENLSDALNHLGNIALGPWDSKSARPLLEESLAIRRGLGDKHRIAASLMNLGNVARMEGDSTTARTLYEESLAIGREIGDRVAAAWLLFDLGTLVTEQGKYDYARSLLEEGLALSKELGDRENVCSSLFALGDVALCEGEYARAQALLEESLAMGRELGLKSDIAMALQRIGALASAQGDQASASALYEEAAALRGETEGRAPTLFFRGLAANERGEYAKAHALMEEVLALYVQGHTWNAIVESMAPIAEALIGVGQIRNAAILVGGADHMMSTMGATMCTPPRIAFQRAKATARAQLGNDEFEQAWQEGQAMTMEELIKYAQEDVVA